MKCRFFLGAERGNAALFGMMMAEISAVRDRPSRSRWTIARMSPVLHWDAGSGDRVGGKRRTLYDDVTEELQVVDHHLGEGMDGDIKCHQGRLALLVLHRELYALKHLVARGA